MQTFLPYPDFIESAKVLDDARLRKQQTEAEQILKTLATPEPRGWSNHPAVLQWKGYEICLTYYLTCVSKECTNRGFKGRHNYTLNCTVNSPPWFGDDKIHLSHKSRLLFKGRVDAACVSLKSLGQVIGIKVVNNWLLDHRYPMKNQFKLNDILRLEDFLINDCKIPISQNYYRKFWPDIVDTIPYTWPITKNGIS